MNISSTYTNKKSLIVAWVVCLCAGLFFSYELMQFHLLNAISTVLMKDLKITAAEFGVLGSSYLLADVIFLIPAGILLDRFSTKKVILSALFICLAGTVGFALSENFIQAAFSHFLSGIGNAFCFLSCIMFISRWFPLEKQGFVVGVVVTLGMLGGVIAQAPFSFLAEAFSWRNALLIDAGIGALIFFLITFFVKDAPYALKENQTKLSMLNLLKDLRESVFSKQNIFCGLYTALTNLPLMVIGAAWGSLFLIQARGVALSSASLIASMICMGTIVGSSLAGYLSDITKKRKPLMLYGAVLSFAVMLIIMFYETNSPFILTTLFFLLGLFSSTQVLGYPLITEASKKHLTGTSMSVAALIIMGLAFLAQFASGTLIDMKWSGEMVNGSPLYSKGDFTRCFSMFPIGFLLSCFSLFFVKEKQR